MMFESNTALRSFYSISTLKIQIRSYSTYGTNFCVCRSLRYCYHKFDDLPRRPVITMTIISEEELLRERPNGLIR
jgi:hypothetical protein